MEMPKNVPAVDQKAAEAAARLEFPHINADTARGLVVREKLGTINEQEKQALGIVRNAEKENRNMTDAEGVAFWKLLE